MDKDKKILFDGRFLSLSHAGIGRYSMELLRHILPLDKAQKYVVIVPKGTQITGDLAQKMNERENPVEVIEVDATHYSIAEQTKLPAIIRSLKVDLVHFPHFSHPLFYNGDFVVTIHDLTLSLYAERGGKIKQSIYKKVISHAAKKSKKILTVSEFVKKELLKEFDLLENRVVTTYNGIDESFKKITNPRILKKVEEYGLKNPYILSVGQWRSHKNLLRLIEAYSRLVKEERFTGQLDLVFVGKIDKKYPELKKKVAELGLEKSVKFTGFVPDEDLPIVYNNAELFVFPSLAEGFGLPGLEAQACGIPVASSDKTSLPEIFGKGAIYFNPLNANDMAAKIKEVLTDDRLRSQLIKEGLVNAKRFSWDQTARKTLEVYQEILYKDQSIK